MTFLISFPWGNIIPMINITCFHDFYFKFLSLRALLVDYTNSFLFFFLLLGCKDKSASYLIILTFTENAQAERTQTFLSWSAVNAWNNLSPVQGDSEILSDMVIFIGTGYKVELVSVSVPVWTSYMTFFAKKTHLESQILVLTTYNTCIGSTLKILNFLRI